MALTVKNLFANLPAAMDGESVVTLFDNGTAKVERIVSHGHSSPEGFWYDEAMTNE
jgi:cupin 2 domain-containing protein